MGTEGIPAKEAAEILGVDTQTVYTMHRTGALRGVGQLRQNLRFDREEVAALAQAREERRVPTLLEMQEVIVQLSARNSALERRVEMLERMQGVTAARVGSDENEVLGLLWKAQKDVLEPKLSLADVREWCKLLFGIHEEFFHLVECYADHAEPWRPFLDMAQKLYEDCPAIGELYDHKVVAANVELAVARRNLRQAAWVYVTKRRGVSFARTEFPETDADPVTHVLHDHIYFPNPGRRGPSKG
jgi:hypothetical protein